MEDTNNTIPADNAEGTAPTTEQPTVAQEETKTNAESVQNNNTEAKDTPQETKEPEKVEEKTEEPVNPLTGKVTELTSEIEKLKAELITPNQPKDADIPLDQATPVLKVQKDLVSEYEGIINGILDAKLADVPENLKELVPSNLNLQQKLDWLNKAEKTGIFKAKDTDIEIGKPLNPNNVKQHTDTSKLSASSLLSMAYGSKKK